MKSFFGIGRPRRSFLLASAFAPVCLGVFMGGGGPSIPQSPTKSDVKIINKTTSLEITSIEITDDGRLHLLLKNNSSKNLNGFEVWVRDQARITTDTSIGDWAISPGATHDMEFPPDYVRSEITILAAMFADGSIEGDPATVIELKQWRLGLKRSLTSALLVLEAALESPEVNSPEALDRLESQLSSLSPESDTAQSHSASGSRSARGDLISSIQLLRQRRQRAGALMQRQRILELKAQIERRIASL